MASICELLINAVKANKPKVLIGLHQNGNVMGRGVSSFPSRRHSTSPANRESLTHPGTQTEHGKPVPLPNMGKLPAREADRSAGKGRRKKRRLCCNGRDRGLPSLERVLTSVWSFMTKGTGE
jgi:hypothetical protein